LSARLCEAPPAIATTFAKPDGTFVQAVDYTAHQSPSALVIKDFNNDGILDVVTVNEGSDDVSFLAGIGNGTLQAPVQSRTDVSALTRSSIELFNIARAQQDMRSTAGSELWQLELIIQILSFL
jgi:hypothetical protein